MLLSVIGVTPLYYPLLLQCHTPLHLGVQGVLLVVTPRRAGIDTEQVYDVQTCVQLSTVHHNNVLFYQLQPVYIEHRRQQAFLCQS